MSMVQKIISFLLIPVMFISFTGARLHLHKCGTTGELYSDVHFARFNHDHFSEYCSMEDLSSSHSCCEKSCENEQEGVNTCCLDLQKEIETDENFISSTFTYRADPVHIELSIPGFLTVNIPTGYFQMVLSSIQKDQLSSPFQSMTVLRL